MSIDHLVFGIVTAATLSLLVSGCAPEGEGSPDGGGTVVAPMSLENRDLQFAGHILLQLADMRRVLDDAQTLFPNTRQQSRPGDVYEFGCRTMKKIWPDPASDKPSNQEKFGILYNCIDSAATFARVDLDGQDTYSVAYPEPLPRDGEAKERPLATSIAVSGSTVYSSHFRPGTYTGNDEVRVNRKTTFLAQVSTSNETELVFDVDQQIDDGYDFDVSKSCRDGAFTTKILATVTVDKKTRRVKTIAPYFMGVSAKGTQWTKASADRGAARSNPVAIKLSDYEIVADGPVGLNADSCELPDSNLIIRKGARAPVDIVVAAEAGKITVDGVESQLKACDLDRAADPLYAQVLEGVFF